MLGRLGASCQTPLGGYATVEGSEVRLAAFVASLDGTRVVRREGRGPRSVAARVGLEVGEALLEAGADEILREIMAAEGAGAT